MALVNKRIFRISDAISAVNPQQIAVEPTPDSDLGFKMYGGKDDLGVVTKWLAKDQAARITVLQLTGPETTGDAGLVRHDAAGDILGGQMDATEFNTYLSYGGIHWARDVAAPRIRTTDSSVAILANTGAATSPSISFTASTDSGFYWETGVNISIDGERYFEFTDYAGIAKMHFTGERNASIEHSNVGSGGATLSISNFALESGAESNLFIRNQGVNNIGELELSSSYRTTVLAKDNLYLISEDSDIHILANSSGSEVHIQTSEVVLINLTSFDPIPIYSSDTEWMAYEAEFGTEYPILQAIVDAVGAGGISGPVSSTNDAIVLWDGTGGDTVSDSGWTISSSMGFFNAGVRCLVWTGTYLLLGKDDGGDGTLYTAMQALSQCQFWVDGAERARFTNSALDMLSHDIRKVRVATFDEFQSITVSGGTATIDFDDGGKATVNLNNQSAAILQFGEIFGNGVGDFQIVLVQGTTPTAPGNIAWTTEGTHPIDIPSGGLDINASASGRTLIDVVYDGYRWYLIGTPMSQYISS